MCHVPKTAKPLPPRMFVTHGKGIIIPDKTKVDIIRADSNFAFLMWYLHFTICFSSFTPRILAFSLKILLTWPNFATLISACIYKYSYRYSWVPNRRHTTLINFSIFFHSGYSYSNLPPINYWGKFPFQTNVLKQYTYAAIFAISQKERPICILFCFLSSCKEANTLRFVL